MKQLHPSASAAQGRGWQSYCDSAVLSPFSVPVVLAKGAAADKVSWKRVSAAFPAECGWPPAKSMGATLAA